MKAFDAKLLPLNIDDIDTNIFLEELIDATVSLEVYKSKLDGSKLDQHWFLPTLQQKEALASSMLEGTQATLDGVLVDQVNPKEKDKDISEVRNYFESAKLGYKHLSRNPFSVELFKQLHYQLLSGNVRKSKSTIPGEFRKTQNYIGHGKNISFVPPVADKVDDLIENFIQYLNEPNDKLRPLVRVAIAHAHFETIHPFMDGNGRVGRILIPLFLYKQNQISLPCFFLSEALERDKFKYYDLLNNIRLNNDWNSWIKFFLETVKLQCTKYIDIIENINSLYEKDLNRSKEMVKNNKIVDIINLLYQFPVITSSKVVDRLDMPTATAIRYLNLLVEEKILYTDGKSRNKIYYYYDLLNVIR